MIWRCRDRVLDFAGGPLVMGVVNVTPDSFSDGGRYAEPSAAVDRALALEAEGAAILDLGGESTRPGSAPVPAEEQWRRLEPVFERLGRESRAALSVDTSIAEVAAHAIEAGAHIVNDVTALSDPAMSGVVAMSGAGLVLMHMKGTPATMQEEADYEDVAREVRDQLLSRRVRARAGGVEDEAIAFDPGIGFAKTAAQSVELLGRLAELVAVGRPVVIGASRKSFIGKILDLPVDQRLEGGLGVAAVAVFLGARVIRTHDVAATVRAVKMAEEIRKALR
jgi:dihydropteroate synthase